jgi:hypothetical protein
MLVLNPKQLNIERVFQWLFLLFKVKNTALSFAKIHPLLKFISSYEF